MTKGETNKDPTRKLAFSVENILDPNKFCSKTDKFNARHWIENYERGERDRLDDEQSESQSGELKEYFLDAIIVVDSSPSVISVTTNFNLKHENIFKNVWWLIWLETKAKNQAIYRQRMNRSQWHEIHKNNVFRTSSIIYSFILPIVIMRIHSPPSMPPTFYLCAFLPVIPLRS